MAACDSLDHILPENPTLLESLSPWKQIKSNNPIDNSSFTELFEELQFKDTHINPLSSSSSYSSSSSSSSSSPLSSSLSSNSDGISIPGLKRDENGAHQDKNIKTNSDSFSPSNSESLPLCTEGLGFESFDDVDDRTVNNNDTWHHQDEEKICRRKFAENHDQMKRSLRTKRVDFPPPISGIGSSGKPCVCFESFRKDGRFILKEIRIPTQEFLHACRENGRLRLKFCSI